MLCLKKYYREDLLQLALLLSLLRTHRVDFREGSGGWAPPLITVGELGQEPWQSPLPRVHPKNPDSYLLDYQEQVLRDLNSLGRFSSRLSYQNVTAYVGLTNNNEPSTSSSNSEPSSPPSPNVLEQIDLEREEEEEDDDDLYPPFNGEFDDSQLSPEDMDLIEVLWKQDVDMGFSLEEFQEAASSTNLEVADLKSSKLSSLELTKKVEEHEEDPWAGLSYTIDLETGEYILKEEVDPGDIGEDDPPSTIIGQSDFSLEEALQLVGLNEDSLEGPESAQKGDKDEKSVKAAGVSGSEQVEDPLVSSPFTETSLEDELDLLADMIQAPSFHHHHHHPPPPPPRPFQGRMAYMRTVSTEQRWQELAGLLSLPPPSADHYHHYHAPPPPPPAPYHHPSHPPPPDKMHHHHIPPDPYLGPGAMGGGNNVGSAVASSMNLMTNGSEPMGGEASNTAFKMENPHDMMYYQNSTSDIGGHNNADGFLSSILNDEDLQLMDMAMNEGMYTMRMLEGTDSDSAVSSMGSERVPSLTSDTDWMETNSDSGHTPADHFMTDCHSKYRWYDYGTPRQHSGDSGSNSGYRMPPVAQKKHHMYGRRVFQEQQHHNTGNLSPSLNQNTNAPFPITNSTNPVKFELRAGTEGGNGGPPLPPPSLGPPPIDMVKGHHPEIKYSCSIEFSRQNPPGPRSTPAEIAVHNHTYHMPPEHNGVLQRPLARDKKVKKSDEDGGGSSGGGSHHLSRDERRARALNIPLIVEEIINLPMDEFNERLSKFDLTESQLSLIRDIRRRGKNKVAAQNCRKRKLDQILSLADEVKQMRDKKQRLLHERELLLSERHRVKTKFTQLYRPISSSTGLLVDDDCALSIGIKGEVVGRRDRNGVESRDTSELLLNLDKWFGTMGQSSQSILKMFGKFNSHTDGLFVEGTVSLVHKDDTSFQLVQSFSSLMALTNDECPNASATSIPSLILITSLLFSLLLQIKIFE